MQLCSDTDDSFFSNGDVRAISLGKHTRLQTTSFDLIISNLLSAGKTVVLDFWHYKCPNCIRTLPQIMQSVKHQPNVALITCALGFSDSNAEVAEYIDILGDLITMDSTNTHIFVDNDDKSILKERYDFKSVPCCITISHTLETVCKQDCSDLISALHRQTFLNTSTNVSPKAISSPLVFSTQEDF